MFKTNYYVAAPGIMMYEVRKLTEKQAEQLRKQGYTVVK